MILTAPRLITPGATARPGWVRVEGDIIAEVGFGNPTSPPGDGVGHSEIVHLDGVLAPGFVDQHCHGGGGAAFTDGPDAARTALRAHLAHGTTSVVASLVTDTSERLIEQTRALRELLDADDLLGVHLEGPWLSPSHRGAHSPGLLQDPDPHEIERVLDASDGAVVMVTLATERPGGDDAVRAVVAHGAIPALGHSDATYDEARRSIDAGVSVATHLFNAERPLHHREPGLIAALLESPRVTVELIADGVHVHPAALRAALAATPGRHVLVTDAMAAAGAADGAYRLGPLDVVVAQGQARLPDGTIAGSTLTLDAAVRFVVTECGLCVEEAIAAAATRPAELLGRPDLGRIAVGAKADLVSLADDLHVARVMRRGRWIG